MGVVISTEVDGMVWLRFMVVWLVVVVGRRLGRAGLCVTDGRVLTEASSFAVSSSVAESSASLSSSSLSYRREYLSVTSVFPTGG